MLLSIAEEVRCCTQCHAIYRADFARCPSDGALLELRTDDPLIGQQVGEHYIIESLLGEGGMGRVYRAHHARLQRRNFAIKVLLGDLAATIATRIRFAQEADAASRLDHPNVVPVVDFGKTPTGLMFLAMELVTGRTLGKVIDEEAPLAPDRVVALARQMCAGLAHAHGHDLVHRDFKPDNVMIVNGDAGEVPRILDFGLAISDDEERSARLTTAGFALGTPTYASPEQTHGDAVDARADLFALGVTMYEMLCGKTPHDGTAFEVIRLNARSTPPPLASRANVVVPPALEALVVRLLARRPEDRFGSAAEVIAALDALDDAVEPKASTTLVVAALQDAIAETASAPVARAAPAPRRRWLWGAALAALLVGGGVALFAASRPSVPVATTQPSPPAVVAPAPASRPPVTPISPVAPAPISPTVAAVDVKEPAVVVVASMTKRPRVKSRAPERVDAVAPLTVGSTPAPPIASAPTVAPAPPPLVEPSVSTVPVPDPSPPPVRVVPRALLLDRASLAALTTRGSMSSAVVRRAVDRAMPEVTECARRAGVTSTAKSAVVRATFVIDESRRSTNVAIVAGAAPGLASCVARALASVRTADPPDVGSVAVSVDVNFSGGPP